MLQLRINNDINKVLDTTQDLSVNLEYNNAMFGNVNDLAKSFSYPFTLPNTSKNSVLLDFPSYINNSKKWQPKQGSLYCEGILIASGDLVIRSASNTSISVNLQVNRKLDWFNVRKMTELTELGYVWQTLRDDWYCQIRLIQNNGYTDNIEYNVGVVITGILYETKIIRVPFFDINTTLINLRNLINADTANNNCVATSIIEVGPGTIALNLERADTSKDFSVMPIATYDSSGFTVCEYYVHGDSDPYDFDGKDYIDYVMANLADFFFVYAELQIFPDIDTNAVISINYHEDGEYNYEPRISPTSAQLFVQKTLEKICDKFGYTLDSEFLESVEMQKLFFANNNSNPPYRFVTDDPDVNMNVRYHEYLFFVKDKLPDMTLADWLESFKRLFCLNVDIDHKKRILKIETIKSILASTDLISYVATPDYTIENKPEIPDGYTYAMLQPTPTQTYKERFDLFNKVEFANLVVDNGANKIESNIHFIDFANFNDGTESTDEIVPCFFTGWNSSIPNYDKIAVVDTLSGGKRQDYGMKGNGLAVNGLLFYRGFLDGKPVSSWDLRYGGEDILKWGSRAFVNDSFSQQEGLYKKYWGNWIAFLQNSEPVKRTIFMNLVELSQIDLSKKVRIDNHNFFIKKLRVTLTHKTEPTNIVAAVDLITI